VKRYLLDTCAMGDFVNRRRGVHERARAARLDQCTVVSEDSDLFAVPGLSVVNWASQEPDH
jgi:hypothetical protein